MAEARRLAGFKPEDNVPLRYLPKTRSPFEGMGQAVEAGADSAHALITLGQTLSDPKVQAAVRAVRRVNARAQDSSVLAPLALDGSAP